MKYKTHIKLVHEFHVTCFQYNVKNQLSNSTFCSDNDLRMLILVVDGLY